MPPKKLKCDPALAEPTAKKPRVGAKPGMFKRHGSGAAAEPEAKRPRAVAKAKPKAKAANIQPKRTLHDFAPCSVRLTGELADTAPAPECGIAADDTRKLRRHGSGASATRVSDGGLPEVNSLTDMHNWPSHIIDRIDALANLDKHDGVSSGWADVYTGLAKSCRTLTVSGAFSGIETQAVGMARLMSAFQNKTSSVCQSPKHLWVIEWDKHAIAELLVHPSLQHACVFGDIAGFINPAFKQVCCHLTNNPHLAVDALQKVVVDGSLVTLRAYCQRHKKRCRIRKTDLHFAGTPCTAYSSQGAGLKNDDPNILHLLVWCALMVRLQIRAVGQENVSTFPTDMFQRMLGHMYSIDWFVTDIPDFGWAGHRTRKYHGMTLNGELKFGIDSLSVFMRGFHRVCNVSLEVFFCAPPDMVQSYLEDLLGESEAGDVMPDASNPECWIKCLLNTQVQRLEKYRSVVPGRAFSLGQNPCSDRGAHSDADGFLHTVIKNCRPMWIDCLSPPRLAIPEEILGTQGLYIFPDDKAKILPAGVQFSSFDVQLLGRKRNKLSDFAGNAMNVHLISVLTTWLLLSINWRGQEL